MNQVIGRDHDRKTVFMLSVHEQGLILARIFCKRILLEFTDFVYTTQLEFDWSKYLHFI